MTDMNEYIEMIFRKDGVEMHYNIETPFKIMPITEKIVYEDLQDKMTDRLPFVLEDIQPVMENGLLKELKFEIGLFDETSNEETSIIQKNRKKIIEKKLPQASLDYKFIGVPREFRNLFPGYKIPFILETNVGELETYIVGDSSSKIGDGAAGTFISKGMTKWFKHNSDIKPGDKVVIEVIDPGKRYKLYKKEVA